MTRIDFYTNAEPKLQVACKLVAKAVQQKLRVIIYAPDETTARGMDRTLWTWQAISFVPHCMASDALAAATPVLIARSDDEPPHQDVLLNLHAATPPSFSRFVRLIEIVGAGDEERQLGRARFRHYRDRGYEILHHDLGKTAS